jgi:hypothetical protein
MNKKTLLELETRGEVEFDIDDERELSTSLIRLKTVTQAVHLDVDEVVTILCEEIPAGLGMDDDETVMCAVVRTDTGQLVPGEVIKLSLEISDTKL